MTYFFNIYIYNYIYIYVDIFIIVFYLPFYCNIRYAVLSFDVIKKILNFKKKKKKKKKLVPRVSLLSNA